MNTNDLKPDELHQLARDFALKCKDRMSELHLSGKKRDDACINYYAGGVVMLQTIGQGKLADTVGDQLSMLVAINGYMAVVSIGDGV